MARPFIVLGDKTSHGGTVVGASAVTDTGGRRIARVGDKVTCPKKGHGGTTVIVSGDPTVIIDGKPAARHGDACACGATLIASQSVSTTAG
ncbi:MAG: PAAR domain-containing protein [Burkholderiales bacterium]|nr:PAAR domain-containing protein [Burkholderiales bacterium]